MKKPRLSVIVPTLNEEVALQRLFRCHGQQPGLEWIIVDAGSTDRSAEIVAENQKRLIDSPKASRAFQLNLGAKQAQSDRLFFLHADTLPPDNFVELLLNCDTDSACFRLRFDWKHPLLDFSGWCTRFNIDSLRFGDQGLYTQKNLFEEIGGFREDLQVMEDQEIITRLKKRGSFKVLKASVKTSARKYRLNGAWQLQWIYFQVWYRYHRGQSQEQITAFYRRKAKGLKH